MASYIWRRVGVAAAGVGVATLFRRFPPATTSDQAPAALNEFNGGTLGKLVITVA